MSTISESVWSLEEPVDFGDDGGAHLAQLGGAERQRQEQAMGGAAPEADVGDDLVGPQQGDVLDQEPDHALAFALGDGRVTPQPRKISGQGQDLLSLAGLQGAPVGVPSAFVVVLGVAQRTQFLVPFGFERLGHQAVVGVDGEVAALGELGFVAGPVHLLVSQVVGLLGPGDKLVVHGQGHFEGERRHRLDEQVPDGTVDVLAEQTLARRLGFLDASLLAEVLGHDLAVLDVVADGHALAAAPADHEALQ